MKGGSTLKRTQTASVPALVRQQVQRGQAWAVCLMLCGFSIVL